MSPTNNFANQFPQVARLFTGRTFSYPIRTKSEFTCQMMAGGERVEFNGAWHDVLPGAELLPDFFFPLQSGDDLVEKVTEFLISRGLLPLPLVDANVGGLQGIK